MTLPQPVKVAVLISGAGSNMAALIDAGQAAGSPFEVVLVISNRPDAGGIAIAEAKGVTALTLDHRPFGKDREAHERAIDAALTDAGVERIVGGLLLLGAVVPGLRRGELRDVREVHSQEGAGEELALSVRGGCLGRVGGGGAHERDARGECDDAERGARTGDYRL